ncbi:sensor histidine kinase [Amphritea japonica]|uniref:histidine kinase n=1 Tax=Amphritea japonica ATCC BAA-1530 TaxID=1278309 RepID=A0A7R6PCP9_9GAMM|nr:sensor histidine kinase [Amphritea japonica]BBB27607.1 two-component system sensor histidine kinase [Amphritea japonica ATCC BAA-1530]
MNLTLPSLERRIRRGLILLVVPAFILLLFILHNVMHRITSEYIGSRLGHDVENIITAIEWSDDRWQINENRVSEIYKRVRTGHYYVISWDGGELRSRSLWDAKPEVTLLSPGEATQFRVPGIGDEHWLVWQQGVRKQGRDITIWVAEDISTFVARQNEYEYYLLTILVALTLLILLLQRRILQWGFGTLKPLQNALLRGKVSGAVNLPEGIPQEVKPLADAIERLVDHSGKQLSRSRMATGNLAHELKLPLQHLQMLSEAAESSDNRESLRQIYSQLQRRIESELRRARISGSPAPGELFNPREELPYLVQLLNQKRGDGEIELTQQLPDDAIPFDRDDMLELLGNLLDNAWRYARSRVLLSIRENRGSWTMIVSDDGPGIPVDQMNNMIWRGTRADEQGENNHGLGLSICNSVVSSYNGRMSLNAGRLGGLQVIIDLPQSVSETFEEGRNDAA